MDELIKQVLTILRGMWKYRRAGMAVTWVAALLAAGGVLTMKDRFEASARVHVDTQSILRPLMSGLAVQPDVEQQVLMLSRTLISRPNVERLIRSADLDLTVKTKEQRDALIDEVTKNVRIRATERDNLYTLSYTDTSPDRAQRVVQALLTIFVESSLGASRTDSDSARRFLEEQIKAYETKLVEAETRLKDFKLRNLEVQFEGDADSAARMSQIAEQLREARLQLREAESAREAARRQLDIARGAGARAAGAAPLATPMTPELDARINEQKRTLDALLQRYTDQHPDVQNTRRLIRDLEEQRKREIQAYKANPSDSSLNSSIESSLAVQELNRTLAGLEVQVASLRARTGEFESRLARAREQLKLAPQLESELAQLNRDYEVHQSNYRDLVSRRESASLSSELETASSVADFRVIDPPRANKTPVAPNRVLLLPMALVVGLAVGGAVMFLLSQIRPVFFDAASLSEATEMPLLGVVSKVINEEVKRKERRSLKRFGLALAGLVGLFVLGMAALSYRLGQLS